MCTLFYERPAKHMENGKTGGVRTPKPLNQLKQNLTWVIMSAISSGTRKNKASQKIDEMLLSRGF